MISTTDASNGATVAFPTSVAPKELDPNSVPKQCPVLIALAQAILREVLDRDVPRIHLCDRGSICTQKGHEKGARRTEHRNHVSSPAPYAAPCCHFQTLSSAPFSGPTGMRIADSSSAGRSQTPLFICLNAQRTPRTCTHTYAGELQGTVHAHQPCSKQHAPEC